MKMAACITTAALVCAVGTASAAVVDDFETGSFDAGWDETTGASVVNAAGDGSGGSDHYAAVAVSGSNVLGDLFVGAASPQSEFTIDLDFRIQDTTNRQFNLQVGVTDGVATDANFATINLRYQSGGFAAFNGASWVDLGLGSVAVDTWHTMQVTGSGWGTAGASYDVTVNGNTASGLTSFHNGDPTAGGATGWNVNAAFGSNPGFDVDNVSALPEPGSLALLGLGGLLVARRRRG